MAIQIKRSSTNASTDLPGALLSGEMAVVQALKKVYIGRHNNSAVEVFHLSTLNDLTGGNGITATLSSGANDNAMSLAVDVSDSNIFGTTSAKGLLQADSDVFQVTAGVIDLKADGIDDSHIDFGTGAGQVDTDVVPEGSTNLFHTTSRARASVSATDAGGDGSFAYNSTSGVLTYTGPSAAEVRTHFSDGVGVTITNGSVAIGQSVATDQSPAFAGLDIGGSMTITGNITGDSGNMTVSASGGDVLVEATTFSGNNVVIPGNLTVNGETTTVKSNTVIIDDPIFQLGAVSGAAPSSDDNKDRGVIAHYYSGSAKQAFFGLDDSSGRFTFIPDATESTGVISGSLGHAEFGEVTATTFHGTIDGGSF